MDMHFDDQGSGKPVILLHGLGGSASTFEPQARLLRSAFRVLRPDLPGAGRSGALAAEPFEALTDRLLDFADRLAPGPVHWVGHSLGGVLCQMIAQRRPDSVASLSLIGPIGAIPEPMQAGLRARAGRVRRDSMQSFADEYIATALAGATQDDQPAALAYVRDTLLRTRPEAYAAYCEFLANYRGVDTANVRARTLLITGRADPVAPLAAATQLAGTFARGRLEVLESCGHWATLERPAAVTELLVRHFAG